MIMKWQWIWQNCDIVTTATSSLRQASISGVNPAGVVVFTWSCNWSSCSSSSSSLFSSCFCSCPRKRSCNSLHDHHDQHHPASSTLLAWSCSPGGAVQHHVNHPYHHQHKDKILSWSSWSPSPHHKTITFEAGRSWSAWGTRSFRPERSIWSAVFRFTWELKVPLS